MICYYIVQSVSGQAAKETSYKQGHRLVDGYGFEDRNKAESTIHLFNEKAWPGVSYDLLACEESMDCGMRSK